MQPFEQTDRHKPFPAFLYGTAWKEERTAGCVEQAVTAGFRGIDTANQRKHYFEQGVGEALQAIFRRGALRRGDLFLQSKFTERRGQDHRLPYDPEAAAAEQVQQSLDSSLMHLGVDYLDSYILHGPTSPYGWHQLDQDIWKAMESCHARGKTLFLGVSNVSLEQLQALCVQAEIGPTFVQNRCFARTGWDRPVRQFCLERGIIYQGFSLLTANPEIFQHPDFIAIVKRTGVTPAQIVFAFALGIGILPLTGTTDPVHMAEDLASLELELSTDDLHTIETLVG
ncbi:aldo/keto reductase family protein [Desulfobulbus alkaliphilus]|uniref:aldo/keto reductase family protein n=1 Tax=Desulfobulbus alkaliphilus TaxID=869814 RepID=UPI001966B8D6|nr:aldo/keto reductase [Desulfobulbus alkaliphilus]MBM9537757.1 aldo/keto reductase [Desulfobulbus alkaliphilus]